MSRGARDKDKILVVVAHPDDETFIFGGTIYKNMKFTIDDRGKKTPLLINRDFMNKANISIDPSRKFILTERLDNLYEE